MNTAVRDGAVMKNPCQIAGAGSDRAKERPVASPAEVVTLLEAITPRYRAAVFSRPGAVCVAARLSGLVWKT
jgi:hypothetical protein